MTRLLGAQYITLEECFPTLLLPFQTIHAEPPGSSVHLILTHERVMQLAVEGGRKKICSDCGRSITIQEEDYRRMGEQYRHLQCPAGMQAVS